MLKIKLGLVMIILRLSTLAFSDDGSSYVDNYLDFEEQTFGNSIENRLKLYQAFYPPNNRLAYSVVVTYQSALPNGTIGSTSPLAPSALTDKCGCECLPLSCWLWTLQS